MKKKSEKEYIISQICKYYKIEESNLLAKRLGITDGNLRKIASRLKIKKPLKVLISDGFKECTRCKKKLPINNFRRDRSQPTGFDYNCKTCRKLKVNTNDFVSIYDRVGGGVGVKPKNIVQAGGFGKKKTRNPITYINGQPYLKCKACEEVLTLDSFHKDKNNISGHKNFCKSCVKIKKKI